MRKRLQTSQGSLTITTWHPNVADVDDANEEDYAMYNFEEWADQLKALSDVTRLNLIKILLKQELSVEELAQAINVSKYSASRHLQILRNVGIIQSRKEGRRLLNGISEEFAGYLNEKNNVLNLGCCVFYFDSREDLNVTSRSVKK